jgi:hypothetical protein
MNREPGPQVIPPGGYFVYDVDGEHVSHYSRAGLIEALTAFRLANGRPIIHPVHGAPAASVDKFLSSGVYQHSTPVAVDHRTVKSKPWVERINSWLANRVSEFSTLEFVNVNEANRRAAICLNCPRNLPWRTSCRSCRSESIQRMERIVIELSGNRQTKYHDRLFACEASNQENRLAVWLKEPFLKHRSHYGLPNNCWMKKL